MAVPRYCLLASVLLLSWASTLRAAHADHALEFLPSYYPQEIRIATVDPASAPKLLSNHSIHVYIGDPFAGRAIPPGLGHTESLGSYLVVTFNPASPRLGDPDSRCATVGTVVGALVARKGAYIFHPYPVTSYHTDYLQHFDLAETAKRHYEPRPGQGIPPALKIRAKGKLAEKLVPPALRWAGQGWDASVEEISTDDLLSSSRILTNGWLGPPWIKEGWFHAYLLHAGTVTSRTARQNIGAIYQRLVTGAYESETERLNLERRLVSLLLSGCERIVLGYTLRREYFNNSDYSEGVENIAYDAHAGFTSPIFLRTVKLKDFLWNGWLRLGVEAKPRAAWNPLGGFTDATGRLIWFAVGDPAQFPHPYNGSWIANRVTALTVTTEGSPSGGVEVPSDALIPEPGTGTLRPVGEGKAAKAKILYRVLLSSFHDTTRMTAADVLYPYTFAYRWGVKPSQRGAEYDPFVDASTAPLREWLAGIRVLPVEQETKDFGETKYTFQVQPVEVYVKHTLADLTQVASVAAPWSTLPWHVIALMEEAVKRGFAAFSLNEAKRRGVPWLDLVRDQAVKDRLATLVEDFRRRGYVPASLGGLVTSDQARARWAALQEFDKTQRHFLVTNGPYRLHRSSGNSVTLQAFRDVTYPLGLGLFNDYPLPRRAYITHLEVKDGRLEVRGDVEKVLRFQRTYTIAREPLQGRLSEIDAADLPVCRYVVVGQDGAIADLGNAPYTEAGSWSVELTGIAKPGLYAIIVALSLGGNEVSPEIKMLQYRVP